MDDFAAYLRTNTSLRESSIQVYDRTIREFLQQYDIKDNSAVRIDDINQFVSKAARESHAPHKRPPFLKFLDFIAKPELKERLVRVKPTPRENIGNFLAEDMVIKIIKAIRNRKYRDIAYLQYALACRAREILKLREEKILDGDERYKVVVLEPKSVNATERPVPIQSDFLDRHTERYRTGKAGFLFLPDRANNEDPEEFERIVNNTRAYYYEQLKAAGREHGIKNFGTHDLRRCAATRIQSSTQDVFKTQKALGHSKIKQTMTYLHLFSPELLKTMLDHQKGINDEP